MLFVFVQELICLRIVRNRQVEGIVRCYGPCFRYSLMRINCFCSFLDQIGNSSLQGSLVGGGLFLFVTFQASGTTDQIASGTVKVRWIKWFSHQVFLLSDSVLGVHSACHSWHRHSRFPSHSSRPSIGSFQWRETEYDEGMRGTFIKQI